MKKLRATDIQALAKEAENSEHKEAYRVLSKDNNCRIGVGARLAPSGQLSFFIEVLVYLFTEPSEIDLPLLERKLEFLEELEKRGYSLACQDDSCISCEIIIAPRNLASECETIRSEICKRISLDEKKGPTA